MKIEFISITVRNFESFGNTPIKITLNEFATTMIIAENGAGKTALIFDSIFYVLYGSPMRAISKAQIVNWINKKDMIVTLELKIDGIPVSIIRGQAPSVFKIMKDDVEIVPDMMASEKQKYLNDMVGISKGVIQQLLFIGKENIPFMARTPAARKEFVERILGLQIFSRMNDVAKGKIKKIKADISEINAETDKQENLIKHFQELLTLCRIPDEEIIKKANDFIELAEQKIPVLQKKYDKRETEIKLKSEELQDFWSSSQALSSEISKIVEENKKFESGECPTCGTKIEQEPTDYSKLEIQHVKIIEETTECHDILEKLKNENVNLLHMKIDEAKSRMNNAINQRDKELNLDTSQSEELNKKIDEAQIVISEVTTNLAELSSDLEEYTVVQKVLQRGDAKNKIISEYIPFFCQRVNHYLEQMDFPVLFEFDEAFNESFKARYRDSASYHSFSTGQQARINLALLLTWRDVASKLSSIETNLLVIDEFASDLDENGRKAFRHLLSEQPNTNFIGMSPMDHKDGMDRIIKLEHQQNFTILV